jgi:class 3 adenylate cyclase/predicted ATPase
MRCSNCGNDNPASSRFCNQCGSALATTCHKCAAENGSGAKFCSQCGESLESLSRIGLKPAHLRGHDAEAARVRSAEDARLDGERKTVTALFADIKGSTELMRDLDPEEAQAVIDPVLQLMIDVVHRYDGYVVQSAGDGIFALFGAPVAHEDHPKRAVHAAIAMRDALRHRNVDQPGRPAIDARIGVNTGEVVLRLVHTGGHTEYTPVGHAANLAARMQSAAPAGGIVISEETRRLVEGYFELRESGHTEVKGVAQPVTVYEVIGAGPLHGHFDLAVRRGLTKFVGRESELKQMAHALELAHGGHGQIVAVMAEAGTGKSRLFYEFKATLPADYKVLEAYSVSHDKASAWLPVLTLLHGYFGIQEADDPRTRREKLRTVLAALDPALSKTEPYLFALLAIPESPDPLAQMDAQVKRRRMLDALKWIVQRESVKQPVVIIFEDLHWIDDQTQALLDLLADGIANARLLMLVNYRPEYRHEWTNKSCYSQLRLDPLGPESAAEMLATLLDDSVELNSLKRLVVERTEGNPFFIEEMVQALFDQGVIVRDGPHPDPLPGGEGSKGREQRIGTVKVARSLAQVRLPPTVQGLLASRIDRLPPAHKELVQTLAVMGRESPLGLIRQVASLGDEELEPRLSALQAGEFIYETPAAAGIEYTFKHPLTQEVAYNSLLSERRKLLHERAGAALESMYAAQLDDHLTELARHYSHSDNVTKAVEYLGRAGQQALERSAYAEGINSLRAAIDLLAKLPDSPERLQRELHLQLALGPAYFAIDGWGAPGAERAHTRARELCETIGDLPELFPASFGLWAIYLQHDELRTAYELAEQLLRRAASARDPTLLVYAHLALGKTALWMGELPCAKQQLELALSFYDRERHRPLASRYAGADAGVMCRSYLGLTLWSLGYPEQALAQGKEALTLGRELSHPNSLDVAKFFYADVRHLRRDRDARAVQESAERSIESIVAQGYFASGGSAIATMVRGWAMALQGREEGVAEIQKGLAVRRAAGGEVAQPTYLGMLAEASLATGRLGDGLTALTEALAIANDLEDRWYEAETHRLSGELLLRQNDLDTTAAQNCFERAIEISRKQGAKSFELRATMSLARLLVKQGRRHEARAMLTEIYNWFTEGFDTPDLKDAKSLLDELSA